MADGTATPGTVDLQTMLAANLASCATAAAAQMTNDLVMNQRSNERYMHQLDRVMLANLVQDTQSIPMGVAGLNTASHAPSPQPWAAPVRPAGT